MRRLAAILAVFLLTVSTLCAAPSEVEKLAVPKSVEQSKAEHFVRTHYAVQYAKHDAASQLALSHQLRGEISQYADEAATRFVMLREARELALDGGDLDAAYAAIDDMGRIFAIDTRELKVSAMAAFIDKSAQPPPVLIETYLKKADAALDTGDVDMANKAYQLASMLSDQQRDPATKQRIKTEHVAIMDAVREQKAVFAAMNKVKLHPEDAESNLLVGQYACFVRELWKEGLPYLAKSSNETLKKLAQQELDASDPAMILAAADAWWDYSPPAGGKLAQHVKRHAADLYREALPDLSGADKDRAQQRASSDPVH
jgi:hypothetical protein